MILSSKTVSSHFWHVPVIFKCRKCACLDLLSDFRVFMSRAIKVRRSFRAKEGILHWYGVRKFTHIYIATRILVRLKTAGLFISNRKPLIRPLERHAARKEKNHGGKNCALQPWASVRLQRWSIINQVNGWWHTKNMAAIFTAYNMVSDTVPVVNSDLTRNQI